jgi:hypothetical protein
MRKRLYESYHGSLPGKVSAVDLVIGGDDRFSILWEGEKRELSL